VGQYTRRSTCDLLVTDESCSQYEPVVYQRVRTKIKRAINKGALCTSRRTRAIQKQNRRRKKAGGKLISADRNLRRLINGQPIFGLRVLSLLPHRPRFFFSLFIAEFFTLIIVEDAWWRTRGALKEDGWWRTYAQLMRVWVNISAAIYTSELDSEIARD